jgi:hypothetical protein
LGLVETHFTLLDLPLVCEHVFFDFFDLFFYSLGGVWVFGLSEILLQILNLRFLNPPREHILVIFNSFFQEVDVSSQMWGEACNRFQT